MGLCAALSPVEEEIRIESKIVDFGEVQLEKPHFGLGLRHSMLEACGMPCVASRMVQPRTPPPSSI